jgi:acyl-CoA thioester hydrolase
MKRVKPYIRLVNYYETDKMGVVHHSNYIRYFEEARLHFLEEIGIPYDKIEEAGVMIPVLDVTSNYLEFVKFKDELRIEVEITEFNGVRMTISYFIYNNKTNKLCNTGITKHCFLNNNYQVIRLKNNHPNLYDTFLNKQKNGDVK